MPQQVRSSVTNVQAPKTFGQQLAGLLPAIGSAFGGPVGGAAGTAVNALANGNTGQAIAQVPGLINASGGGPSNYGKDSWGAIKDEWGSGDGMGWEDESPNSTEHEQEHNQLMHIGPPEYGTEISGHPGETGLQDQILTYLDSMSPEHADYLRENPDLLNGIIQSLTTS